MHLKRRLYQLVGIVLVLCGLAGCVSAQIDTLPDDGFTISIVTKAKDGEYWMSFISGVNKAARDYDINVVLLSPGKETEAAAQKKMITDMLERDIDALAISPIDSYDSSYLAQAEVKGIPVYATDSDYYESEVPYIGYDNYQMGQDLAREMKEQLGNKGRVGVVSGSLNQAGHKARVDGFCEYLKANSEIETAFIIDGYSGLQLPEAEIEEMLRQYPDVGGIFVTNAVAALGLSDYMIKQQLDITICAADAQEDALEAVAEGQIHALANHSGYENGYRTIQRIVAEVRDKEEQEETMFHADIITRENIADYDLPEEQ